MDKITKNNEKKWDTLVLSDVPFGRPWVNLTSQKAKEWLDLDGIIGDLNNKKVLCLASGGGQQSIGFALLGAIVTVIDFSSEQLKKDELVSKKFSKDIRIIKSDMRDLSMLEDDEFDFVYHPYSINYIPETSKVFDEVSRVTKIGGMYHLMIHNPFVHGTWDGLWDNKQDKTKLRDGKGYPIWQPYKDSHKIQTGDPNWSFSDTKGNKVKAKSPQEFKHTLSTVLNGLTERGFKLLKFDEEKGHDYNSKLGTWDHYISVAPPWLYLWFKKED